MVWQSGGTTTSNERKRVVTREGSGTRLAKKGLHANSIGVGEVGKAAQ